VWEKKKITIFMLVANSIGTLSGVNALILLWCGGAKRSAKKGSKRRSRRRRSKKGGDDE